MTTHTTNAAGASSSSDDNSGNKNIAMTVTLLVLIGVILAIVPWSKLTRPSTSAVREALETRFTEYSTLRKNDDWDALYDLAAPRHRRIVDKRNFLKFFGHGMLKPLEITLVSHDYTVGLETGKTVYHIKQELQVAKLPPQQRASLNVESPEDLIQEGEHTLYWERHGGTWFFHMEEEVVSGKAQGEQIRGAFDPAPQDTRRIDPTELRK